jgi:UDP-N-acetylmuramate: L-alanyl-gamma-D-glutamyl-meso-diaminopimelate ligase
MTVGNHLALPKEIRRIHLIAICGTGMGALACMLKEAGYEVGGSDQHVYPPISEFLKNHEIPIQIGFHPDNLRSHPDLVVVGNAVSKDNAEVRAMQEMGLPYCSMPQAVNRFAAAGKRQLVVAGTHGKTTTSSFLAWLLATADLDPSFLIGGIVSNFNSNYRVGQGNYIVLEGDEYDTAFFDKGPKFLHYNPEIAILTSVEFDHADIFRDLGHVKDTFGALLTHLNSRSVLLAFDGDSNIRDIIGRSATRTTFYGHNQDSSWYLGNIVTGAQDTRFEVYRDGDLWGEFTTSMIGEHNLRNLLAGIAAGHRLGLDRATISLALKTFRGVKRRQEIRGIKKDITVIDDFAHHPTAVRETVRAVKTFYDNRRLIAVFEPRTNSSRRNVFQSVYATAFDDADMICIRQAPMLEKIPAGQRFSSEKLVDDLCRSGKEAFYFEDTDRIINFLLEQARPRDIVLIMSNGGFDNIHARLLDRL